LGVSGEAPTQKRERVMERQTEPMQVSRAKGAAETAECCDEFGRYASAGDEGCERQQSISHDGENEAHETASRHGLRTGCGAPKASFSSDSVCVRRVVVLSLIINNCHAQYWFGDEAKDRRKNVVQQDKGQVVIDEKRWKC
jgi:hypothetical protein